MDAVDEDDQLRIRMIRTGLALSVFLVAIVAVWALATWQEPNRPALLGFDALALAATIVIALITPQRIVASRHRERFFLTWSLSLIGFIGAAAAMDGGARSPVLLLLFLTMAFAALTYPRNAVIIVSGASAATVLLLSQLPSSAGAPSPDGTYIVALTLTIVLVGFMCVWQARILQDQRSMLLALSRQDPLTGCLNRRGFELLLGTGLDSVRGGVGPLSVVMLDFDDFKLVNDTYGHAAGDELLAWAAAEIRTCLRDDDIVARLGGDEFALLLPGLDEVEAASLAARVRTALSSRISVSTGTATATAHCTADDFLRAADRVLYAAKATLSLDVPAARPEPAPAPAG